MLKRNLYLKSWDELSREKSMIFLSGPRQAGKTTLAKTIAKTYPNKLYFNWDIIANKKKLIQNPLFFQNLNRQDESTPLIIFDEIHKYKNWKNYLKGTYDEFNQDYQFLISGSGRLDVFQKGGDSLAGRYLLFHLFPLTIAELSKKQKNIANFLKSPLNNFLLNDPKENAKKWKKLEKLSGFPEPFLKNKKEFWRKWSNTYTKQLIREDIRSILDIKNIDTMETLFSLLPARVGSPLSMNNLAGDLEVAFDTVKNWINLFENFYLAFTISPWSKKISRSINKEKKIYLFNYPEIEESEYRFENMVGLELLRAVSLWNERGWGKFGLYYIRNKEKEEVDFLIANNNRPFLLIETKLNNPNISKNLIKFQDILNVPAIQLVNQDGIFRLIKNKNNKIVVATAYNWLSALP